MLVMLGSELRTLAPAAYASAFSGEHVVYATEGRRGRWRARVVGSDASGEASLEGIGPADPVEADAYLIAAPATEIPGLVSARRHELSGRPLLLAPGGFGGVLRVRALFAEWQLPPPLVCEVTGWLGAGRRVDDETMRLSHRKQNLPVAGVTDAETQAAAAVFSRFVPDLVPSDLVTTSLSNINTVGHPAISITNATRMENGETYALWGGGFSGAVARLMTAIDEERLAIVRALGGEETPLLEWMHRFYGHDGFAAPTLEEGLRTFPPYREYSGPDRLDDRFLTDDVPFGLAAFERLAEELGLPHPVLTAVRSTSEVLLGRDLGVEEAVVTSFLTHVRGQGAALPS